MILIVDNFDSFTYNIVQYFYELNQAVIVWHNDQATLQAIAQLNPDYIVISPGPCTPNEAGISLAVIEHFAGKIPILGVCLGMQAIGQAFGGQVVRAKKVMHGRVSRICHDSTDLFAKLPSPMRVTRYHSLVVEQASLPDCLQITAYTDDGLAEIMAIRHRTLPVVGVQFHPEAILSEHGHAIFQNFLTEFEKINQ